MSANQPTQERIESVVSEWSKGPPNSPTVRVIAHFAAEVRRLTDEVAYVRGIMQGQEGECRAREEQEKVRRCKVESLTRSLEEAHRSDAGRVEVPELTAAQVEMAEACCDEDDYPPLEEWALDGKLGNLVDLVAVLYRARARARLSTSPQPATGAVDVEVREASQVILDEWDVGHLVAAGSWMFQDAFDALRSALVLPSPQPAAGTAIAAVLLPCPFCGGTPDVEPKDPERHGDAWATVFCPDEECPGHQGVTVTDEDGHIAAVAGASTIWNRRAPSPQPSADVVVVPREEWSDVQGAICWCEISAHWSETRKRLAAKYEAEFRAFRSSTNHDSKETP